MPKTRAVEPPVQPDFLTNHRQQAARCAARASNFIGHGSRLVKGRDPLRAAADALSWADCYLPFAFSTNSQSASPAALLPGGVKLCSPRGLSGAADAAGVSPVTGSNQCALNAPGKRSQTTTLCFTKMAAWDDAGFLAVLDRRRGQIRGGELEQVFVRADQREPA